MEHCAYRLPDDWRVHLPPLVPEFLHTFRSELDGDVQTDTFVAYTDRTFEIAGFTGYEGSLTLQDPDFSRFDEERFRGFEVGLIVTFLDVLLEFVCQLSV